MTEEEAKVVAVIIGLADGGCPTCVRKLAYAASLMDLGWTFAPTDRTESIEGAEGVAEHFIVVAISPK